MATFFFDTIRGNATSTARVTGGIDQGNVGWVNFPGDSDWHRMNLLPGERYRFEARREGISGLNPTLRLHNAAGAQLAFDDDGGGFPNALIDYSVPVGAGGTYFLNVQGLGASRGRYRVRAYTPGDQPSDTTTTHTIAGEQQRTDLIAVDGDRDMYRIQLVADRRYTFSLDGAGPNPLGDPALRLRNSAGAQIAFNDNFGGTQNARITYTPTAGGTYFLEAQAANDAASGRYRLDVDDIAGSIATHRNIAIAGVPNGAGRDFGRINHAGDSDWFRVFLRAGELYEFEATGTGGGAGLSDPTLRLRNSAGAQLAFANDTVGLNPRIRYRPDVSGTHYLDVRGFGQNIGNYRLTAREVPANAGTYSVLPVLGSLEGDLHANGDQDWHRVRLTQGRTYQFDLRGASSTGGTLVDPVLEVRDPSSVLRRTDFSSGTGRDARIRYTAAVTGDHFLNARSFANVGTGTYTLQSRPVPLIPWPIPPVVGAPVATPLMA